MIETALIAWFLISPMAGAGGDWTHVYDHRFREAALHSWPQEKHVFWAALKAQAACESSLRPDAVSPVGASGIAQFMPGTWQEVVHREGWEKHDPHPHDADWAIRAQAIQVEWLAENIWTSPRPPDAEMENVWASYNAGQGNVLKAQELADGARDWPDIAPELHRVTGEHSRETIGYVECIAARWEEMTGVQWRIEALQGG